MTYSLGIDIGSSSAKLSLVDSAGKLIFQDSRSLTTSPGEIVNSLFSGLPSGIALSEIESAGVSGSGQGIIPAAYGWSYYSSALATTAGVLPAHPEARTIIQIGGQSSLVVELEDGLKKPWKVATNPLCAAGTGRFMEQQAYRLGISLDDFARLALSFEGKPPRIAARCSVFAKSDLIHLQQKGVSREAMLYGLCESIARLVVSLKKGEFREPILLVGGVAANAAIRRALAEAISLRNSKETPIEVPDNYLFAQSLGAALLSRGKPRPAGIMLEVSDRRAYYEMPALPGEAARENGATAGIKNSCRGYLGVDVGSTSTKAVILDETGKAILAKSYLMTAGQPIDAVKQVFRNLLIDGAQNVEILAAGITGSGRYLVGGFIGADLIKNEITAQARAAAELDPDADVIEIGGQDSKLIIKRRGVVADYQMNKACAAGTGSFIDELAELLGVQAKNGDFARLALSAPCTVDLGSRCAAFIGQAVSAARQDGLGLDTIVASLTTSIAKNYLSKVVAHRRLGKKVILTGAVFYNEAVVAAFRQLLPDKELIVADQREVSGAIGAALLAKEELTQNSSFKGFSSTAESACDLTSFTCHHCDNNCAITRMKLEGGRATYYGSRCDRYDAETGESAGSVRQPTYFDAREALLFADYKDPSVSSSSNSPLTTHNSQLVIGIPRALQVYDFAPLLIGFLNRLGVKVLLSSTTTQEIMEESVELAYTDSCLPVKLLYGHVASIKDECDFILYPCSIRMGLMDGNENQKYSCPLVQASPFMLTAALGLEDKLLSPILDFSRGDEEVIANLTDVSRRLGFSVKEGRQAALAGLAAQRRFERARLALGEKVTAELKANGKSGVVIFARSYMSQDPGANLGVADKLARLGVAAVPLDCLPLGAVNPRTVSDRPYWFYESKYIAGAAITAREPNLFGLIIGNFGCGPNSFMTTIVEDMVPSKPLGQLEIDEHAAEAGLVTRLEAFTDTIQAYLKTRNPTFKTQESELITQDSKIMRTATSLVSFERTLLLPRMSPHVDVLVAALRAYGVKAQSLPEPDVGSLDLANAVTSGTECLPYRVTLGDFLRFCRNGYVPGAYEGFMAGSYGPCRLGKYVLEQNRVIHSQGYDFPIRSSVSNNAYRDVNLGAGFQRMFFCAVDAVDGLQKLLWRTRPYEIEPGLADRLFENYMSAICMQVLKKQPFDGVLRRAALEFDEAIDKSLPRRPRVGINGEIYLRANEFSNSRLVRTCEAAGLEAVVSPMGEWMKYILYRHIEDAARHKEYIKAFKRWVVRLVREHDERGVYRSLGNAGEVEESIESLLDDSRQYLSPRCGSEAVLSLGSGVGWMRSPHFAGAISVMPHGCMPGGIVASISEKISTIHNKPWISLTYDGFKESNNQSRINEFAELVKFQHLAECEKLPHNKQV